MKTMLATLAFAILCAPCFAQQYTPTKAQHAKLLKQRAKIIAMQEKISDLQNEIAYALEQATATCKQIAAQNGWPEGVACNLQTLAFVAPLPAPPKPQLIQGEDAGKTPKKPG